jgi:uncharacterized protein involved in cysteine biosynthesis
MLKPFRAYNAYLTQKAWDAGKYGSLNEMKWQFLLWMLPAMIALLIVNLVPGISQSASECIAYPAFALWFAGIPIVGIPFIKVGVARRKRDKAKDAEEAVANISSHLD